MSSKPHSTIIDEARDHARAVVRSCIRPHGFYASGLPGGYEATWSRDSMITSLGASLLGAEFQVPFRRSIELLGKHQTDLGLIPNAVGTYNTDRKSDVTFNSIDAPLWFIIGSIVYERAYRDMGFAKKNVVRVARALQWLRHQDPDNVGLIVQQPTGDWQDAFPHKYGYTIANNALYYAALSFLGDRAAAEHVRKTVNGNGPAYLSLYDATRGYYLPWVWKNHVASREEEYWFDSFGNVLAIVTGLATPIIARRIVRHIERAKINSPYPLKAVFPPIKKGDPEWHEYFNDCDARTPYEYLNGGVWPFIGGFYVAALVRMGEFAKAERELRRLAEANALVGGDAAESQGLPRGSRWGFHEWLHGKTGKPQGQSNPYQAWSAGAYLFAYESVRRKKVPYFS